MLWVITGGSGSGKSEYAEKTVVDFYETKFPDGKLYYVATMQSLDEETDKKVARHREMRKGKGFLTIECPMGLGNLAFLKSDVVLIECMSNLLANEMYHKDGSIKSRRNDLHFLREIKENIIEKIWELEKQSGIVLVVTNEVFSDGMDYDEESLSYIEALGYINQQLAKKAVSVVEVVCGIPVWNKKE